MARLRPLDSVDDAQLRRLTGGDPARGPAPAHRKALLHSALEAQGVTA